MAAPSPNPYDRFAYRTQPMPQTHPDRLATIALLHGMAPRPIDRCRVLELGCGDGSNLIPMAYGLPGSEFVGVDLAADRGGRRSQRRSRRSASGTSCCTGSGHHGPVRRPRAPSTTSSRRASTRGFPSRCATGSSPSARRTWRPTGWRSSATTPIPAAICARRSGRSSGSTSRASPIRTSRSPRPAPSRASWRTARRPRAATRRCSQRDARGARPLPEPPLPRRPRGHQRAGVLPRVRRARAPAPSAIPRRGERPRDAARGVPARGRSTDLAAGRRERGAEGAIPRLPPESPVPSDAPVPRGGAARPARSGARPCASLSRRVLGPARRRASRRRHARCRRGVPRARATPRCRPTIRSPRPRCSISARSGRGCSGFDELCGPRLGAGRAGDEGGALLDILLAAYTAGLVELATQAPRFALDRTRPTASPVARLQLEHGASWRPCATPACTSRTMSAAAC